MTFDILVSTYGYPAIGVGTFIEGGSSLIWMSGDRVRKVQRN